MLSIKLSPHSTHLVLQKENIDRPFATIIQTVESSKRYIINVLIDVRNNKLDEPYTRTRKKHFFFFT